MRRTFARLCVVGVMWIGGGVMAVPAAASVRGAPSIAFTPASLDYGTLSVGQTASQTFVLKNSGGSATGALTVSLSGSVAFTKRADSCTATSLGPNKMCSVTVTYAPTTTGTSDSATLTATGKTERATATAALTGTTKTTSRILCESYGGTFTLAPLPNNLWSCTGWSYTTSDDFGTQADALTSTCLADGGNGSSASASEGVANFFCQLNPRSVPPQ
jgi:hypothetical protein